MVGSSRRTRTLASEVAVVWPDQTRSPAPVVALMPARIKNSSQAVAGLVDRRAILRVSAVGLNQTARSALVVLCSRTD